MRAVGGRAGPWTETRDAGLGWGPRQAPLTPLRAGEHAADVCNANTSTTNPTERNGLPQQMCFNPPKKDKKKTDIQNTSTEIERKREGSVLGSFSAPFPPPTPGRVKQSSF